MATGKPTEIFMENLNLKKDNQQLQLENQRILKNPFLGAKRDAHAHETVDEMSAAEEQSGDEIAPDEAERRDLLSVLMTDKDTRILIDRPREKGTCPKARVKSVLKYCLLVLIIVGVVAVYVIREERHDRALQGVLNASSAKMQAVQVPGILPVASQITGINDGEQAFLQKYHLSIGMRQDQQLQECQSSQLKHSFPDVDYALLGYNILKGFPLAVGHDPGFTYPIFKADYSKGGQTADCRYSVPSGLVIIPDVSCVTSFSSTTVRNKYEFSKSLGVSARVKGEGWGVAFSASAGYKQASSEMSTGESVFILSTANCNYYFSKLIIEKTPPFDDVFLQWIYKLNATDGDTEYFNFFETYGTHFPTEVTFGARFTYEHKMSSQEYETQLSKDVNVAVEASYNGLFSAGGGFNMDASQREAASNFAKSVTTKTITVGAAPPANGDAMTWASEVKNSPVPTAYQLSSIDQLFTERQLGNLNIDYERIRRLIERNKKEYCKILQSNGTVETCKELVAGIQMKNTRLHKHYKELLVETVSDCIETCLQEVLCEATTYCTTCKEKETGYKTCFLFKQNGYTSSESQDKEKWQSNIYSEKIKSQIEFTETGILGTPRGFDENPDGKHANVTTCYKLCMNDAHCVAYSHCQCPEQDAQCRMYSKEQINGLEQKNATKTYFISSRSSVPTTVKPLLTTTPELGTTEKK